jgi:multidrug efflux system membrane fusion protein
MVTLCLCGAAGCAGEDQTGKKRGAGDRQPPVPVKVAEVVTKAVPLEIRTFGTVEASATVAVKSQITGILTNVHFREGQDVNKHDLLFTIDPGPFQVSLKQAEAILARDTVQWKNAEKEANHQEELCKKGLVPQDTRDQAKTTADALAATVRADSAAAENARIQLEYCFIRSPIDGRTGNVMVDPGNLVKANDITLATINQIKPVRVSFMVPQQKLADIREQKAQKQLDVRATIPGNKPRSETGTLTFVDNAVDPATGTIRLKGTFANDSRQLWPGLFVNVTLLLTVQTDAVAIPSAAVQAGQKGTYVFVVYPDLSVSNRTITVDRSYEDLSIISAGLSPGERIVTDGQLRLTPGAKVELKGPADGKPPKKP